MNKQLLVSDQKLKLMNRLSDDGPATFTELLEFLNVSKTRIADHINELEKMQLIAKIKQKGVYDLTDVGRKELRKQNHIGRFRLITSLGEELGRDLKSCAKASEIRKELIRVEPDLSLASSDSLVKWLRETTEWKRLGDDYEQLRQNTSRLKEAHSEYGWFLDYALGEWSTFENRFRSSWHTKTNIVHEGAGKDDPEFNPELKYYKASPSKNPLEFIRSLLQGNLDVLGHAKKRLGVALRYADEANVHSLVKALEVLDLMNTDRRTKSVIEQTEDSLETCLEKLVSLKVAGPIGSTP
jgi:Mn-dependent DtxR family transcriptional regulator